MLRGQLVPTPLVVGGGHDARDVFDALPLVLVGLVMGAFGITVSTLATRSARPGGPRPVA